MTLRKIGLHLRMVSSFSQLLDEALALHIPIFQCFFITPKGSVVLLSDEEIEHRYAEIKLKYQNKVAK